MKLLNSLIKVFSRNDMFRPPRGTRDYLPWEMWRRNWVIDRIREVFEAYGYEPLGTPAFESWEMLKLKSGEDIIREIYYFKDKSNRELGLRFEWTASLCRVVASHRELPKPFKRYAIGPVWRYERPSEKRLREFWQADVDIVGVADPIADAEVISVAVDALKCLGLEGFKVRINDRRILEAFVELLELPRNLSLDIFRAIDKLNKIGVDGVERELSKLGIPEEKRGKLMEMIDVRGEPEERLGEVEEILKHSELGLRGLEALRGVVEYSGRFGFRPHLLLDLSLARGLDYYTGPVFEIYLGDVSISIAAGGRYDELIQLYGGDPTPATGISLGVERIVATLQELGVLDDLRVGTEVFVASASNSVRDKAIEIAQRLRRAGISTDLDLMGRSLSKQLEYANRRGFRKVVIVGSRELEQGGVTVRDMETGEQRFIPLESLLDHLGPR